MNEWHIHTVKYQSHRPEGEAWCESCGMTWRVATFDENQAVKANPALLKEDGPLYITPNNIVVPIDYNLKEALDAESA